MSEDRYYVETDNREMIKSGTELFVTSLDGEGKCTATAHIHHSVELLYITEGGFRIFVDDEEYFADKGDLILFPSNSIHRIYTTGDGHNAYIVIKIKPDIFAEMSGDDSNSAYIMRFVLHDKSKLVWKADEVENGGLKSAIESLQRELSAALPARDVAVKVAILSLLIAILRYDALTGTAAKFTGNVAVARQIYKAITYINRNYGKDISAADCAAYVNMSYSYFSRTFKDVTKKSFKQYLTEVRINHAEKELMLSDKSVTEICFACGFGDVSYFIAQYKALRGKTPHRFRKERKL